MLFLNSGADRVLALDRYGKVVRDTGPIPGLNPGGGNFGSDRRYYVGLRSARSIMGFSPELDTAGEGDNTIVAFARGGALTLSRLVTDPELSPLDLAIAPNGNILVSSEHPFGMADAVTTVREYDAQDGHLIRVFSPNGLAEFQKPRGLCFIESPYSRKALSDLAYFQDRPIRSEFL